MNELQKVNQRCIATFTRHGQKDQCKRNAMDGHTLCGFHVSKATRNINSPTFKTGLSGMNRERFASVAPKLLTRIRELRDDPELWSLKDDAAYITALLDVRAEAITEGITTEHYIEIKGLVKALKAEWKSSNFDEVTKLIDHLDTSVRDGADATAASDSLIDLIRQRAFIVETEQKMLQSKSYILEVDQAYSLIMQVLGVIKKSVKDAEEMSAIKTGIGQLLRQYQEDDVIDAEVVDEN
jgi:hypothetical protein